VPVKSKVLTALPAFVATYGGVVLYLALKDKNYLQAAVFIVLLPVLGTIALEVGRRQVESNPVQGTLLLSMWILVLIAAGAALTALFVFVGLQLPDWISDEKKISEETKDLTKVLLGAATAFVAVVYTDDLDKAQGELWPSTKTKQAYKKAFGDRGWDQETPGYQAIYEERVPERFTTDEHAIEGWGLWARYKRAKILEGVVRPHTSASG
jgi:hypothetical protein